MEVGESKKRSDKCLNQEKIIQYLTLKMDIVTDKNERDVRTFKRLLTPQMVSCNTTR